MNNFCLIVDDELSIQSFLAIILTKAKVANSACSTVSEMVQSFSDHKPDLIFLDAALEGCDAVDALRRLGSIGYSGTVQLVSGRAPDVLEELRQMGNEYGLRMRAPLQKPFSVSQVRQILKQEGFASGAFMDSPVKSMEAIPLQGGELRCKPLFDVHRRNLAFVEARVHTNTGGVGQVAQASSNLPLDAEELVSILNFCRQQMPSFNRNISSVGVPAGAVVPCLVSHLARINVASLARTESPDAPSLTWLTIELTEDDVFEDLQMARQLMLQLRIHGANTRIRGAGALFLSLGDDRGLPIQEVTLTAHLMAHSGTSALKEISKMVAIVKRAGAKVIAEAIAAPFDLSWLAEAGFDLYDDAREADFIEPAAFAQKWGRASTPSNNLSQSIVRESSADCV
jgi:EAL domain-containing protein (putative c-di-GMP-specific phosphodiesterase class I)